jgi:nucleoside-diphosphate-sugar epimerase
MRILVTGGAGYVGSVLVPTLLEAGHEVRVLDNLRSGGQGLLGLFANPKFEFLRGDVRDTRAVSEAVSGADLIMHLAAIVGYPACSKDPRLAREVNLDGTMNLAKCRDPRQPVIFASTCSNYGAQSDGMCTEETPLHPLTVYGATKTQAERYLLEAGNVIVYRFATAFGMSPRMRLDLLVNDFVCSALRQKQIVVYEKNFMRPFIHVRDMAEAFLFALDHTEKMTDDVYNVGSQSLNVTKETVALLVRSRLEFLLHFADFDHDADRRNYKVSFAKIRSLGFETSLALEDGIEELIRGLPAVDGVNPYSNA